jgi:hypothetical protein
MSKPSLRASLVTAIAAVTAVGGVYAATEAFGLSLPRWAWHQELENVREELHEVAEQTKENTWGRLQTRWLSVTGLISANDIKQTAYTATGQNVPQDLLEERRQLLFQKLELERQMNKLDE